MHFIKNNLVLTNQVKAVPKKSIYFRLIYCFIHILFFKLLSPFRKVVEIFFSENKLNE